MEARANPDEESLVSPPKFLWHILLYMSRDEKSILKL